MSLLALQLHVSLPVVHSPVTANTCIVIIKIMFELKMSVFLGYLYVILDVNTFRCVQIQKSKQTFTIIICTPCPFNWDICSMLYLSYPRILMPKTVSS